MVGTRLDANQVIKQSFDEVNQALKIIPSSATSFGIELDATDGDSIETRSLSSSGTSLNAVSAASNQTSSDVDIFNYKGYNVSYAWSGLTGTLDGTLKLQGSNDQSLYIDTGDSVTMSAATGSGMFNKVDQMYRYFRVVYTKNLITAGSITAKYVIKG